GRAGGELRLELVKADRVPSQELAVAQAGGMDGPEQREGQRGVAARERLQVRSASRAVGVRTGSTTITWAGDSGSQCSCWCGADAEGLAPHTTMQAESRAVRGSKPSTEVPYT